MSTVPELTATSYAILGLLAVKPWTSYELTQQMDRGLSRFWPRAQSKLYEEPKKLVARGLARASVGSVGKRPRTLYSITPKGRRALSRWLATPSAGPTLEAEHLVRVFFAEHGSKADLLATLAATRTWAEDRRTENVAVARGYVEGDGPFPDRLAHSLLVGRFLADFEDMLIRWADWANSVVEGWPEDIAAARHDPATLDELARRRGAEVT